MIIKTKSSRLWLFMVVGMVLSLFFLLKFRDRKKQQEFTEQMQAIAQAMADSRFPKAANQIQALLKSDQFGSIPNATSELRYQLGSCMASMGQPDRALEEWALIAPASPAYARSLASSATLFVNSGRYRPAEEALTEALAHLATADQAALVLKTLSRLYRFEGRTADLKRVLHASFPFRTDRVELLKELWLTDYSPQPVESWKRSLNNANPTDDRVLLGHAAVETLTGQFEQAQAFLDRCKSATTAPDHAPLGIALSLDIAQTNLPAFWATAQKLPTAYLEPAEPLVIQAWLASQNRDEVREQQALLDLLKIDPARGEALQRLAELALKAGKPAQAQALNEQKARLDKAKDRVRKLLLSGNDLSAPAQSTQLAAIMQELGRSFDQSAWASLNQPIPTDPASLSKIRNSLNVNPQPTLAESLAQAGFTPSADSTAPAAAQTALSVPKFADATGPAGLNFTFQNGHTPEMQLPETMSGGVAVIDFDSDGWLDIYVVQGGTIGPEVQPGRLCEDRLYRNQRDGTFRDVSAQAGFTRFSGDYAMGVAVGDYNNDSHPDLFISRLRSYALYRNRGDGTFEDATQKAGLAGRRDNPTSAAFADLDSDGDLDLYVCHYMLWDPASPRLCRNEKGGYFYCDPSKVDPAPDRLFRNDNGKFTDVTDAAGIVDRDGRGLGVVAADLDGDNRQDLYVANDGTANFFFKNVGGLKFEETALAAGLAGSEEGGFQASMGVACGDYNGDGLPDIVVTNFYGECSTLYQNLGQGLFRCRTTSSGLGQATRFLLGFGTTFGDFNNDGSLDLATVNGHVNDNRPYYPYAMPAQLLLGTPQGRLIDTPPTPDDPWRVPRVGRGLAVADLNNDGLLDALLLPQNDQIAYLKQQKPERPQNWLTFGLEGTKSNRDAVGLRLIVTAGGRTQVVQHFGGGSYQSAGDPRLHIGLGTADKADTVEAHWPSGQIVKYTNLQANRAYLLKEASPQATPLAGFAEK